VREHGLGKHLKPETLNCHAELVEALQNPQSHINNLQSKITNQQSTPFNHTH